MPADADAPASEWESRERPLRENMRLQRAYWRLERAGWLLLAAIETLALLGMFAIGPLSSGTARSPSGQLQVEYGRFHRNGAASTMQLTLAPTGADSVVLRFGADFLAAFQIDAMTPQPEAERGGADGTRMRFERAGEGAFRIHLGVRPIRVGRVTSEIGLEGEPPARFSQFVFP